MAKAKSGGTRSYIRGRVGADVYSIGKDAKGKKQQVVRSLAETVANPQTQSQMRGRMIMSTVMQAVAALKPIIDHSFDNVTGKQPNISEFISRNYALVKADVAAHPSSGNVFGLNKYQERGAKQGAYVISDGQAALPAALVLTQASGLITIGLTSETLTIAGLKTALGLTTEEYFTLVGIKTDGQAAYQRFRINPELSDETAISGSNIANVFATEGNATAAVALNGNNITITLSSVANCCAVIISKSTAGGFIHNKAVLGAKASIDFNANAALPTYPVGSADYLNGGDIFGMSESFNSGGGDTPAPSPSNRAISGVTLNGVAVNQSGSAQMNNGSNTVVVTIPDNSDGKTYTVGVADRNTYTVGHAAPSAGLTQVNGASVSLTPTATAGDANKTVVLCLDGSVIQVWGTLTAPAEQPAGDNAQLSALTWNGSNILSNSASGTVSGNTVQGTLNRSVEASENYKILFSTDTGLTIGASSASAAGAKRSDAISGSSITWNATGNDQGGRVYLEKNGVVVQICGQISYLSMD